MFTAHICFQRALPQLFFSKRPRPAILSCSLLSVPSVPQRASKLSLHQGQRGVLCPLLRAALVHGHAATAARGGHATSERGGQSGLPRSVLRTRRRGLADGQLCDGPEGAAQGPGQERCDAADHRGGLPDNRWPPHGGALAGPGPGRAGPG
jgi:hypothetical protein